MSTQLVHTSHRAYSDPFTRERPDMLAHSASTGLADRLGVDCRGHLQRRTSRSRSLLGVRAEHTQSLGEVGWASSIINGPLYEPMIRPGPYDRRGFCSCSI